MHESILAFRRRRYLWVAVLLFGGRGKISSVMGDFAKGIKSFKKGMKEELDESEQIEKSGDEAIDVTPKKQEKV